MVVSGGPVQYRTVPLSEHHCRFVAPRVRAAVIALMH